MNNFVYLNKQEDYNISALEQFVSDSISKLGVKIKQGTTVLLKANLPKNSKVNEANTTHPNLVAAVVNVLSNLGANCIVADSPFGDFDAQNLDKVYFTTGMLEVANTTKCELNENLATTYLNMPDGVRTRSLPVMSVLQKVDVIVNLGKLKIDTQLGYCGALTNLFGLLPGKTKNLILNRQNTLKDFYNLILDLHEQLSSKIVLNIVDGIVAKQADGTPNLLMVLAASTNAYALDAQILKILGYKLEDSIIKLAIDRQILKESNLYHTMGESDLSFSDAEFNLPNLSLDSVLKDGISNKMYYNFNQQRVVIPCKNCKGCGVCAEICPVNAINMKFDKNGELFAEVDYKKCIYCNVCYLKCPYKVIKLKTPVGYKLKIKQLEKNNKD